MSNSREYLQHYGVLGMKWGVRKDGKPQGFQYGKKSSGKTSRENKAPAPSEDHKSSRASLKKGVSALSNDQLQALNTRLSLEQTYKSLSKKPTSAGKQFLASAGVAISGVLVTQLVSKPLNNFFTTYGKSIVKKSAEFVIQQAKKDGVEIPSFIVDMLKGGK